MSEKPGNQRASEAATTSTDDIWIETKAENGHSYYWNAKTRCSQWNKPEGQDVKIITQAEVSQKLRYLEALRVELAKNETFVEQAMNEAHRLNRQIEALKNRNEYLEAKNTYLRGIMTISLRCSHCNPAAAKQ